jgi:hypothetical protein
MTTHDDRRIDPTDDDRVMTDADRADAGFSHPTDDALSNDRTPDDRMPSDPASVQESGQATEEPLVAPDAVVDFRSRWDVIQQGFVDDPRNAVSEADHLVDDLLQRLSDTFDRQHQDLEKQWSDGEPSTEDLRSALQRYRAFFQRLLTL